MQKINKLFKFLIESFNNIFSKEKLFYISENANWVTDWISFYLIKNLNQFISCKSVSTINFLRNKIIHFGSINTFISKNGMRRIHKSNKIVLTWFHIMPNDEKIKYILFNLLKN